MIADTRPLRAYRDTRRQQWLVPVAWQNTGDWDQIGEWNLRVHRWNRGSVR